MAPPARWERLQLAALRLREIQNEAAAIYRNFPELDRRPKVTRTPVRTTSIGGSDPRASWPAKFH